MTLRRTIAGWICPDLVKESDRLWRLRVEMSDKIRWLSYDYPIVEVVLARLMVDDLNYARPLGEAARELKFPNLGGSWPSDIYSFREKMRLMFPPATES